MTSVPEHSALLDRLPKVRGTYRMGVQLSRVTWFNVGGEAEIVYRPADVEDLIFFLQQRPEDIPLTILGVGSNLLVRDGGIDGVVIRLGREFARIEQYDNLIYAGAGALDFNVAVFAESVGLGGLEFLSGIPGTIGGALAMNAGAYGSDIATVLHHAEAVDERGNFHKLTPEDFGFVYRSNTLPEGMLFCKAVLKCTPDDPKRIKERMQEIQEKRESTQPVRSRTGGSTFKNPVGARAWELVDQAGCRGLTIGGAQVSEKHCNFLINTGNATASDLESLGEEVRRRVRDHSGVELEWEIKRIGKPA